MKNFESKKIVLKESIKLDSGKLLQKCELAYMTYGRLNKNKSNAILVCHALTGDQYCSGKNPITKRDGWWNILIGPGKVIDTNISKWKLIADPIWPPSDLPKAPL